MACPIAGTYNVGAPPEDSVGVIFHPPFRSPRPHTVDLEPRVRRATPRRARSLRRPRRCFPGILGRCMRRNPSIPTVPYARTTQCGPGSHGTRVHAQLTRWMSRQRLCSPGNTRLAMGPALTPSVRPREEYLAAAGMYHPWAGEATSPDCRLTSRRPGRALDRHGASRRHERASSPPREAQRGPASPGRGPCSQRGPRLLRGPGSG